MNSPYWPHVQEVERCIRTEAEELANATVLAVHEPMAFRRIAAREATGELVGESELLQHLISSKRPTPVLGESGFGKSHVIRWLEIQLMRHRRADWHVVRIGKNSSLRQALTTLLEGLEGSVFDEARRKIDSVGAGLRTRDVAEHLVVFVGTRLSELYEKAERALAELRMAQVDEQQGHVAREQRIRTIRRHAKPGGLASLLADPNFKGQMIGEGRCFYQIAKRLTEGSSDEEIQTQSTSVRPDDLVVRAALGDLSLEARSYVRNARLNTSEEMREEASALLNECLSDASRVAFQQLFQFHGGSFQDLFTTIREYLRKEGKTLFVLVEDMAAISAIEDVLIDSLMQEDIRDGKQVLCPLHSAIAVTTGYQGYARRRDTLSTRAGYEWKIERTGATESETLERISDFCGRYLNAARHGEDRLIKTFREGDASEKWPGVWRSSDPQYEQTAELFGGSGKGFPLFPYTRVSLEALARRYCQPGEVLEFNPRKILRHILREPLVQFREMYSRGEFPPEGFANIQCPGSLHTVLGRELRENVARSETLAAIWGFGAESLPELAHQMPAQIPEEFGLPGLTRLLERTDRKIPPRRPADPPRPGIPGVQPGSPIANPPPPSIDKNLAVQREVDEYFAAKSIPQAVANQIRKALWDAFEERKGNLSDWYGMGGWPSLKQRNLTLIHIPFNANNPPGAKVRFGSEAEFDDRARSLKYKQFMVAVLRREVASGGNRKAWTYESGLEDYCTYANFIDDWLPQAAAALVDESRAAAARNLSDQLSIAVLFDPQIGRRSLTERLDRLVMTEVALKREIKFDTGLAAWDQLLAEQVALWSEKQGRWLESYSTNRHGLEGDLVVKVLRSSPECLVPAKAQRTAQTVAQEFAREYPGFEFLEACGTKEEFRTAMQGLHDFVSKMSSAGQFTGMDGIVTARAYKAKIVRVMGDDIWDPVKCAIALRRPFEPVAAVKALQSIDLGVSQRLNEILEIWRQFHSINRQRIINENEEQGVPKRKRAEDLLSALIERVGSLITHAEAYTKK